MNKSEDKSEDDDSRDICGKDRYVWSQKSKSVRRTPMRNIVKQKPGSIGNGCQADTLESIWFIFLMMPWQQRLWHGPTKKLKMWKAATKEMLDLCTKRMIEIWALIGCQIRWRPGQVTKTPATIKIPWHQGQTGWSSPCQKEFVSCLALWCSNEDRQCPHTKNGFKIRAPYYPMTESHGTHSSFTFLMGTFDCNVFLHWYHPRWHLFNTTTGDGNVKANDLSPLSAPRAPTHFQVLEVADLPSCLLPVGQSSDETVHTLQASSSSFSTSKTWLLFGRTALPHWHV